MGSAVGERKRGWSRCLCSLPQSHLPPHTLFRPGHPTGWETCSSEARAQPPFLPRTKENALHQWTFHHGSQKNMPSQGILHELSLNVSPANTQRLGVVPAFCVPGVVALHGTEVPRAWEGGCRRQQDQKPFCRLKEGVQSLPDSFWRTGSIRAGYSCICKWRVVGPVVLPGHPARELDPCLRMTVVAS